jgi:phage repressor protein C with HTH and peptisase S24 domain
MIDYYRKQLGLTMKELGKKIQKSESAISLWISGKRSPMVEDLEKLSVIFGVTSSELMYGSQAPNPTPISETKKILDNVFGKLHEPRQKIVLKTAQTQLEEQNREKETAKIMEITDYITRPVSAFLSAGAGEWQESDDLGLEVSIPVDEDEPEADYIGIVIGNSMLPKFHDGDYVFINTKKAVEIGQIGVFKVNGENFIKKLKRDENGKPYLESLNTSYDDIFLNEDDEAKSLGLVIGSYRG